VLRMSRTWLEGNCYDISCQFVSCSYKLIEGDRRRTDKLYSIYDLYSGLENREYGRRDPSR
jgi:hypothetical protein